MRRADRLFQIIQVLRRTRKPLTADAIAAELETSKRTIYRDIATLIEQRVPIRGEAGMGYILEKGFDLPPLMLTPDEIEAAVLGAQWVAGPPRLRPAELEVPLPARSDCGVRTVGPRRRPALRSMDSRACPSRRRDPATGAAVAPDQRDRRRVGRLDRDGVPGVRRVRLSGRAGAALGRPRSRRRPVLRAERLGTAPRLGGQ